MEDAGNIISDAIKAVQSFGTIALDDLKKSLVSPIENAVRKLITQLVLYVVVASCVAYIFIFALYELLDYAVLDPRYKGLLLSGVFLLASLSALLYFKSNGKQEDNGGRIESLRALASFKDDLSDLKVQSREILDNPLDFLKVKLLLFYSKSKRGNYLTNKNIILSAISVALAIFVARKYLSSEDNKIEHEDLNQLRNRAVDQENRNSNFSSIIDPLKGAAIAMLTSFVKDYISKTLTEVNTRRTVMTSRPQDTFNYTSKDKQNLKETSVH